VVELRDLDRSQGLKRQRKSAALFRELAFRDQRRVRGERSRIEAVLLEEAPVDPLARERVQLRRGLCARSLGGRADLAGAELYRPSSRPVAKARCFAGASTRVEHGAGRRRQAGVPEDAEVVNVHEMSSSGLKCMLSVTGPDVRRM